MKIIDTGFVSRVTDSFFAYRSWPSVCIDENGVVYVVCSGFRMGHMCPFGKIVMYKSRDGRHFSLPTVVCDSFLDDRDPGILYLGGGRMLVTRCSHYAKTYETEFADWLYGDSGEAGAGLVKHYALLTPEQRKGGCYYKIISDYGETDGEEKRIPVHSPHGPVLLSDGTVFYLGKELFTEDPAREDLFSSYISRDGGETFEKNGECPVPCGHSLSEYHEVHCAELANGRILALFRTHPDADDDSGFTITKTYSDDGGKTWSEWEETGICGSPPHLCKMKDGTAVLTYARRVPPYGIYARKVNADGEISGEEFMLAPCNDSDIGYPASVELPDGSLFTAFYGRYTGDKCASIQYVIRSLNS